MKELIFALPKTIKTYSYFKVRKEVTYSSSAAKQKSFFFYNSIDADSHNNVNLGSSTDLRNKVIRNTKRNMLTAPSGVE